MPKRKLTSALNESIFRAGTTVYSILNGAAITGLLDKLESTDTQNVCLIRGEKSKNFAQVSPYLVRLEPGKEFTEWVFGQGWGNHWGIFVASNADFKTMRKHFRSFLQVESPEGEPLFFRYYDPRVLVNFLPTCNSAELEIIFGPVEYYMLEGKSPSTFVRFVHKNDKLVVEEIQLNA